MSILEGCLPGVKTGLYVDLDRPPQWKWTEPAEGPDFVLTTSDPNNMALSKAFQPLHDEKHGPLDILIEVQTQRIGQMLRVLLLLTAQIQPDSVPSHVMAESKQNIHDQGRSVERSGLHS